MLHATIAALHARLSDAATLGLAMQQTLGSEGARLRDLEARLAEEHAARTEACGMLEEVCAPGPVLVFCGRCL